MKLDTDVLDETFALQPELVFFQAYSHGLIFCFLSREYLILDSILDSLFSILGSRFAQELRIANCIENEGSQRTVNLLLNVTVTVWMVNSMIHWCLID